MIAYTEPIKIAALVFAVALFFLFIPWLIYTFRKYGFLSFSKSIVMFSFIFYFLSALFLVLLPLPETTNTCAIQSPGTKFYNLRPFQFVIDIKNSATFSISSPATWKNIIVQPAFYQALFNFILLMPFGVYLRYFLKERKFWVRAFVIGLGLTLFYEITQVTGIYGIYNCPYRIFDVDDLMLNSLGSLFGFFIAPIILLFFPKHEEVVEKAQELEEKGIVKPLHVLVAVAVDFIIINFFVSLFGTSNIFVEFVVGTVMYVLILGVIPTILNGATIGMKLVRLKMRNETSKTVSKVSIWRRFYAVYVVYFLYFILRVVNQVELNMDSPFYVFQIILTLVSFGLAMVIILIIIVHVLRYLFAKGKRKLFFDKYAEIKIIRK